jgi:putative NADPH-quinone reductase
MRICILQGHPTAGTAHYGHRLAAAYAEGASVGGHQVKTVAVAELDFPLLRLKTDWDQGPPPPAIREAQAAIKWAQHILVIHPLWIGSAPAILKGFFEQTLRPGFAMDIQTGGWRKLLSGRSARIVVTMGMPALVYRWYFGAHGLKSLAQNLALVGIRPVRSTIIGSVEAMSDAKRHRWLERMDALGRRAA